MLLPTVTVVGFGVTLVLVARRITVRDDDPEPLECLASPE